MAGFRLLLLLVLLLWLPVPATAAGEDPPSLSLARLEPFLARELNYDISFLWFDRLAEARFRFLPGPEPDTYQAELEARTLGLAAWLTRDRVQNYTAVMKRDARGIFRSRSYSSTIYKGHGAERRGRTKTYRFDYPAGLVRVSIERNGQITQGEPIPMAAGEQPCDVLTAFFNFYNGAYGDLQPGEQVQIPTFSKQGASTILVERLTPAQRPPGFPDGGEILRVSVDQEVFDTGGGYVFVWFDDQRLPVIGLVENVLGMGNVRGTLRN